MLRINTLIYLELPWWNKQILFAYEILKLLCRFLVTDYWTVFGGGGGEYAERISLLETNCPAFTRPRDQESHYTEKIQNLQQTLTEERDKLVLNANQQKSMLEESLHNTKTEEQRLRTKLAEAEEVGFAFVCFVCFILFQGFLLV